MQEDERLWTDLISDVIHELHAALLASLTLKYSEVTGIVEARDLANGVLAELSPDGNWRTANREYARLHAADIRETIG